MTTTIEQELSRNPAATKPRFDNLLDDFRLYDGTRDALQAIAGAVEYPPAESTSKAEWSEWWKKMGPIFGDVVGGWVSRVPSYRRKSSRRLSKRGFVAAGLRVNSFSIVAAILFPMGVCWTSYLIQRCFRAGP